MKRLRKFGIDGFDVELARPIPKKQWEDFNDFVQNYVCANIAEIQQAFPDATEVEIQN